MDLLSRARTFVRIVEAGSLSAAARSFRLSLPAVSRQVQTLEDELGAKLLERTTRSLRLTDAGRRFHQHATRLVHEADAALASVQESRSVRGPVVVSASVTLGVLRIVPGLSALTRQHPHLELRLRLEDRSADLVSEGVDIAVRAGMELPSSTGLIAVPLGRFERHLVASPAYLKRHGTPKNVAALARHAAVLGTEASGEWSFLEAGQEARVSMRPSLRVSTLLGVREAVLADLGLALLPHFVVEQQLESGALKAVLPSAKLTPVTSHALYRVEQRGTPRLQAVLAYLQQALRA
ncbi:MAG TPA: LysR substrate-binding domain-containing protein [Polyangiaceae bacterium]|nr:LysR substrate-binding domain-containing protein [Polyangiaceae bacterium]